MLPFILKPRWRILYFIYIKQPINYQCLYDCDFKDIPKDIFDGELSTLQRESIVKKEKNNFSILTTESDPFLRILNYVYKSTIPLSRTEIRYKMKHKSLKDIIDALVSSDVFYEHRTELKRTIFIIPSYKKEEFITKINDITCEKLKSSNSIEDQSHLIMINNNISIIDSFTEIDNVNVKGKREKLMINKIIEVLCNKIRMCKTGLSFEEICELTGYTQKENERIILSLVKKGIIKCSRRNLYFVNNSLISNFTKK